MTEPLAPPTTQASPPPGAEQTRQRRLVLAIAIVLVVLLLAVLIGGTIFALTGSEEALRRLRDWSIVLVAVLSIVMGIALVALLYQVTMLTLLLRDEIKPLLESVNETMNTVRGTAMFMSDNVAQPTIQVASTFAGVRRAMEALAGIRSSVKPKQ
jgi:cytochrome c biogenesis protein CcdA